MAARSSRKRPQQKRAGRSPGIEEAVQHYYAGRPRECAEVLVPLIKAAPGNTRAWGMLSACHGQLGNFAASLDCADRALALQPSDPLLLTFRARALRMVGKPEEAVETFERALHIDPDHATAAAGLALLLRSLKRDDDAFRIIEPFLDQSPVSHQIALAAARLLPARDELVRAIQLLHQIVSDKETPTGVRVEASFALGNLLDRQGRHADAFLIIDRAQRAQDHRKRFDPRGHRAAVDRMISAMTVDRFAQLPECPVPSDGAAPLFILGLPRSGTTLVERILSAHSSVSAGGEQDTLSHLIARVQQPGVTQFAGILQHPQMLLKSVLNGMSTRYRDAMPRPASSHDARFVTDKMPANVLHIPLIAKLFPGAPIVRCVRDERDTAVSCYFHQFGPGTSWATSLEGIASYFADVERACRHFVAVLRIPVIDVVYEDLVENPERETRRLVEAAGLSWEEACARPHEQNTDARTHSIEQVNQPINTASVGRWRSYEVGMKPFLDARAELT